MSLLDTIAEDLVVPRDLLSEAVRDSRRLVKLLRIPKRDGTFRRVYQPAKKIKIIQYWLIDRVFRELPIHSAAYAYRPGTSAKQNALQHVGSLYQLKLDFKNFFPSIQYSDFIQIFDKYVSKTSYYQHLDEIKFITQQVCFDNSNCLPIGYPSSPILSNIVMHEFDTYIFKALENDLEFGVAKYTRYADDLVLSTDKSGVCSKFHELVRERLTFMDSPRLILNETKTKFVSSTSGSAIITGLRLCKDGHLTVHRNYKNRIRSLIFKCEKDTITIEQARSLVGHLSYLRDVDGAYYTKLHRLHFSSIRKLHQLVSSQ